MNGKAVSWPLMAVLLLTGCVEPSPVPGQPSPTVGETIAPAPSTGSPPTSDLLPAVSPAKTTVIEYVGCSVIPIALLYPAERVQSHLPEPFRAAGPIVDDAANVNLDIHRCEGIVINQTLSLSDVSFAIVRAAVYAPEEWGEEAQLTTYAFETYTDSSDLQEAFARNGIDASLASIVLDHAQPQVTASIGVDSTERYSVTGTYAEKPSDAEIHLLHRLFMKDDASMNWFHMNHTYTIHGYFDIIQTQASSGILYDLAAEASGTWTGLGQRVDAKGKIEFGKIA